MDSLTPPDNKKQKKKEAKKKYTEKLSKVASLLSEQKKATVVNVKSLKSLSYGVKFGSPARSQAAKKREARKRSQQSSSQPILPECIPSSASSFNNIPLCSAFEPVDMNVGEATIAEYSLCSADQEDRPAGVTEACQNAGSPDEGDMDGDTSKKQEKSFRSSNPSVEYGHCSENSDAEQEDELEEFLDDEQNFEGDDFEQEDRSDETPPILDTSPFLQRLALLIFKHSLSDSCAQSICELVRDISIEKTLNVHPKDVPKDTRTLRKRIGGVSISAKFVGRCSKCGSVETADQSVGLRNVWCQKCVHQRAKESDPFIMSLSIRQLLTKALPRLFPLIAEKMMRFDGVKKLRQEVNFTQDDVFIVANTDGVEIARRSNLSIWPLLFFVYGIADRYKQSLQNVFLAAFWHGRGEISQMQTLLNELVGQLQDIERSPIEWTDAAGVIRKTRVFLLYFCADTPAVVKAACLMHWGSENGCRYCMHSGQNFMDTTVYPRRTLEQYIADAEATQQEQAYKSSAYPTNGVRGVTTLVKLSYFKFPECFPIDPMHSVFGGVFKSTIKALFKSNNACLGTLKATIENWNSYVASLTVPKYFKQYPRPWESNAKFKCHEWGAIALYYLPPVMPKLFKREYCTLMFLLLSAYAILTSENATQQDLDNARAYLYHFVRSCATLLPSLGQKKINFHYLQHYVDQYKLFGPLYLMSLRYFENANRLIVNFGSGNQWTGHLVYKRYSQCFQLRDILFRDQKLSDEKDIVLQTESSSIIRLRNKVLMVRKASLNFKEVIYKTKFKTLHLYAQKDQQKSRFNSSAFRIGNDGYVVREIWYFPSKRDVILQCEKYLDLKLCDKNLGYARYSALTSAGKGLCRIPFPTMIPCFCTRSFGNIYFEDMANSVDLQYD